MKKSTAETLDRLMDVLVLLGMKKVRRGIAVMETQPGIFGMIRLDDRAWPGGLVTIWIYLQTYWAEAERIYDLGMAKPSKFAEHCTTSQFQSASFSFDELADNSPEIARFEDWAKSFCHPED